MLRPIEVYICGFLWASHWNTAVALTRLDPYSVAIGVQGPAVDAPATAMTVDSDAEVQTLLQQDLRLHSVRVYEKTIFGASYWKAITYLLFGEQEGISQDSSSDAVVLASLHNESASFIGHVGEHLTRFASYTRHALHHLVDAANTATISSSASNILWGVLYVGVLLCACCGILQIWGDWDTGYGDDYHPKKEHLRRPESRNLSSPQVSQTQSLRGSTGSNQARAAPHGIPTGSNQARATVHGIPVGARDDRLVAPPAPQVVSGGFGAVPHSLRMATHEDTSPLLTHQVQQAQGLTLLFSGSILPSRQEDATVTVQISSGGSSEFFAKVHFSEDGYSCGALIEDHSRKQIAMLDTTEAVVETGVAHPSSRNVKVLKVRQDGFPSMSPAVIVSAAPTGGAVAYNASGIVTARVTQDQGGKLTVISPQGDLLADFELCEGGRSVAHLSAGVDAYFVLFLIFAAMKLAMPNNGR